MMTSSTENTHSIVRRLIINLTVTIGVVSILAITMFALHVSRKGRLALEDEADKTIVYLVRILDKPFWDFDEKRITSIGEVFIKDSRIIHLTIKGRDDKTLFTFLRGDLAHSIQRDGTVMHNDKMMGTLQIAFSRKSYHEKVWQMVLTAAIINLLVLITIFISTGFWIRSLLRKPLGQLTEIVNSYAAEDYSTSADNLPSLEFRAFGVVLSQMGEKISRQLGEMRTLNLELEQSEEKYRRIFENIQVGYLLVNFDGIILSSNPAAARLLKYDGPHQIEGTNITEEVYTFEEERQQLKKVLETLNSVDGYQISLKQQGGQVIIVECNINLVMNEKGKPYAFESTFQDITKRVNAEKEKDSLEDQLRQSQKLEAIGTLAGGIAHDFNNILAAIFGYTEFAMEEMNDDENLRRHLDEVFKGALRAKDLVKQILTFSRRSEQELQPIKIESVINEALQLLRSSIPTTIEIKKDINPDCEKVLADPTQIHQVIMNLCTNAYHAMRETGGVLGVSLKPMELTPDFAEAKIELSSGTYVILEISDTGTGISKEVQDRIFEPYYTTKTKGEGTGLGLAVVHGIINSLHGDITCYSELTRGTTFRIYLPVAASSIETIQKEATALLPTGNERILVVDDDIAIAKLVTTILEKLGYKVTTCTSSIDSLQKIQQEPNNFDLVITDMTMPNMTGAELAKQIIEIHPDIKIILCSGFSDLINEEKARAIGIHDYLMKPLVKKDLAVAVRKALDGS